MPRLATVAAFGFDDFHPPQTLALYQRMGCRTSQFYRNEANPPAVDEAVGVCNDAGLPIDSIHGVFGNAYDPSSPDEDSRRKTVDVYKREGELALALGGPMVVVHPSPMTPDTREPTTAERQARLAPLMRSMEELARAGEDHGVVYLMENLPATFWIGHEPAVLAGWVREIDSPYLRMCFDTGHALITGTLDQLGDAADVIEYMHLHDNDRTQDNHLMPGDGVTEWRALGEEVLAHNLHVPLMLEVFYLADQLAASVDGPLPDQMTEWFDLKRSNQLRPNAATRAS